MDPLTAISTAYTGVKAAAESLKIIRDTQKALDQAELNKILADTIAELADATIALADAKVEIKESETIIKELEERLKRRTHLVKFHDLYYEVNEDAFIVGSPHCPRCFEVDGLAIHVVNHPVNNRGAGVYCPKCKNDYRRTGYMNVLPDQKIEPQ